MKHNFSTFIKKIPEKVHSQTKTFIGENIVMFKPERFITGQSMTMEDYHFIILHSIPPEAVINGGGFSFKKGSLISLEPGTSITVMADEKNKTCKYISISVKKDFMNRLALESLGVEELKIDRFENKYSRHLLDAINNYEHEILLYGNSPSAMLRSLEVQLAILLMRNSLSESISINKKYELYDDYIKEAIVYMYKYYCSNINIEDICKEIYLSSSYFKRVFKNKTGKTPYQFLTEIRVEKAKEMLKDKGYTMREVARLCGFSNPGSLSAVFKKNTGISPFEYKKRYNEK